jgi:four helix bundle protein
MASVVLNLAEGNARKSNKERRRFFEISRASVIEVAACVDLALAFGLMGKERVFELKIVFIAVSSPYHRPSIASLS